MDNTTRNLYAANMNSSSNDITQKMQLLSKSERHRHDARQRLQRRRNVQNTCASYYSLCITNILHSITPADVVLFGVYRVKVASTEQLPLNALNKIKRRYSSQHVICTPPVHNAIWLLTVAAAPAAALGRHNIILRRRQSRASQVEPNGGFATAL